MAADAAAPAEGKDPVQWHGLLGATAGWEPPHLAARCDEEARPGYEAFDASEYLDSPEVLRAKVKVLAQLVRRHGREMAGQGGVVVYTGAGISTAAGVPDYASRASGSKAPHLQALGDARPSKTGRLGGLAATGTVNRLEARPTLSHAAIAALEAKGLVQHWLQQNHDRLAQKAGFPQAKLNEIHGAWGDNKNSVLQMTDELRPDLMDWLVAWAQRASLVLAMGTSLCGMTSDCVSEEAAARAAQGGDLDTHGGLVIVNLQRTRLDPVSTLRIWGIADKVLALLCKELHVPAPDPKVQRRGEEWECTHPSCRFHTPKRKAADPM